MSTAFNNAKKLASICRMTHEERLIVLAKDFASANGFKGSRSGWIYDAEGRAVQQGWANFAGRYHFTMLDWVCSTRTGFQTFAELLDAKGGYRPTLRPDTDWRFLVLAVAYDRAQEMSGDPRRAFMTGFEFKADGTCIWDGVYPSPEGWQTLSVSDQRVGA